VQPCFYTCISASGLSNNIQGWFVKKGPELFET